MLICVFRNGSNDIGQTGSKLKQSKVPHSKGNALSALEDQQGYRRLAAFVAGGMLLGDYPRTHRID